MRELENAVERAVLVSAGRPIEPEHFPGELRDRGEGIVATDPVSSAGTAASSGSLWEMERDLIVKTLARVAQNRTKAAKELGISVRTLRNKLREYRQGAAGSLLTME